MKTVKFQSGPLRCKQPKKRVALVPAPAHLHPEVWLSRVVALIRGYKPKTKFTFDKVRSDTALACIPPPKNSHAWGAVMRAAHAEGLVESTGRYQQSDMKSAHRSRAIIWEKL